METILYTVYISLKEKPALAKWLVRLSRNHEMPGSNPDGTFLFATHTYKKGLDQNEVLIFFTFLFWVKIE